jgi:hypothetical protein
MMGGASGHGLMGSAFGGAGGGGAGTSGTGTPTRVQLQQIATRVNSWLLASELKGFKVAEVMAFANNDYVAVHDALGGRRSSSSRTSGRRG